MDTIKVALVDDQKLFRKGLVSIIQADNSLQLIAEAESAEQLIDMITHNNILPDVLLLDLSMPGMNGMELQAFLHKQYPSIKTLALSMYDQPRFIVKMIEQGASAYLSKNCDAEELVTAIKTIARAGFYFNETIHKALQSDKEKNHGAIKNINNIPIELTKREEEILILICKEYTTEEIAAQLFISTRTVDGHRQNLLIKTGCKNIAGLVIFAVRNNIYTLV